MPPGNYKSVSLPESTIALVDGLAESIGVNSRAEAIEAAVESYDARTKSVVVEIDDGPIQDISRRTAKHVADELENRLR